MSAPPIDPDEHARADGRATHDGYHYEWHEEPAHWRSTPYGDPRQCRWTENRIRCGSAVRAELNRGRAGKDRWWGYCAAHLFGRLLHDGKVWSLRLVADEETP